MIGIYLGCAWDIIGIYNAVTKDSKETKIADEEPHDEAPPSWSAVLLKLCDELEPWAKWKVYDTVFAVALFIVLRRFKLLVPTAKLLQWL